MVRDILCHILTMSTIATGGTTHQQTVFIAQADRQSIQLWFCAVGNIFDLQPFTHAAVEIPQFSVAEYVAKGELSVACVPPHQTP